MNIDKDILTGIGVVLTFIIGVLNLLFYINNNKKTQFINTVTASRIKWMQDLREAMAIYTNLIPNYKPNLRILLKVDGKELDRFEKANALLKDYLKIEQIQKQKIKLKLYLNKDGEKDEKIIEYIDNIYDNVNQIKNCCAILITWDYDERKRLVQTLTSEVKKYIADILEADMLEVENNESKISHEDIIDYWIKKGPRVVDYYIEDCINLYINKDNSKLIDKLINLTQDYLKDEWERVKKESKNGDLDDSLENIKFKRIRDIKYLAEIKEWNKLKVYYEGNIVIKSAISVIIALLLILATININHFHLFFYISKLTYEEVNLWLIVLIFIIIIVLFIKYTFYRKRSS